MMIQRSALSAIRLMVTCLILSIGLRTWLLMGLIEPVTVRGISMEPTLQAGDRLWIDRITYQFRAPKRWDMVVVRNPHHGFELCVKRIVGLPGETITLNNEKLMAGTVTLLESSTTSRDEQSLPWRDRQWQVGTGEYFLLGDNSAVSVDSRRW